MSTTTDRGTRWGVGLFLLGASGFFLLPLYVMLATSLKPLDEIQAGTLLHLPHAWTLEPWREAWSTACTGASCRGLAVGFRNSLFLAVPGTLLPVLIGAFNGYLLAFWRPRFGHGLFVVLLAGMFIPGQLLLYPMVRTVAALGLFGSYPGLVLVHTVFGVPVLTLLFRQYFSAIPQEIFLAARVDGIGLWTMFSSVMLPLARPMLLAAGVMQLTGVWNDYLLGLVFADRDSLPMTVQLNNIINTTTGTRPYNTNMAATLLTAMTPLAAYLFAGRSFVQGISAGGLK